MIFKQINKLSKKDFFMLFAIFLILFCYLSNDFIITPAREGLALTMQDLASLNTQLLKSKSIKYSLLKDTKSQSFNEKTLLKKIKHTKSMQAKMFGYSYSKILHKIKSKLNTAKITPYTLKSQSINQKEYLSHKLNLAMTCDFTQLASFLEGMKSLDKTISMQSVSCKKSDTQIACEFGFSFLSKRDFG